MIGRREGVTRSAPASVPVEVTREVAGACLCLHAQRAARALGRRFDAALRPFGLTNGQFSLLMSLNRADPPTVGSVADLLAMDRTTLTANLKPLERRGLVRSRTDEADRRVRRLELTREGMALLFAAVPVWRREHAEIEGELPDADRLRGDLRTLSARDS
jgi:DNA-binding MarR family transcriptional regulator